MNSIKSKIRKVSSKVHENLNREPVHIPHKWRIIPNVIINLLSFLLSATIIFILLYWLCKFILDFFY